MATNNQVPTALSRGPCHPLSIKKVYPYIRLLLLCILVGLAGCSEENHPYFQGYVEGEYLLVSSPLAGKLETLSASRGKSVARNTPLFSLDQTFEQAAVSEAEQGLHRAENRLADITKGMRPSELAAIEAKLQQREAAYDLSKMEYDRREKLFRSKVIAKEVLDRTRTEMKRNAAAVSQLKAELETAHLGARPDEIEAARFEMEAARSRLTQARWKLDQKTQAAPEAGLIFDTFYVQGEFVPAGYPVVSILPPGNIKIRFFVPEKKVSSLAPGQKIWIRFDGAHEIYSADISFISPRAEYTPPIIYSRETRSKLVFMIEAGIAPENAVGLHPGQPVDVSLEKPDA